MGLSRLVRRLRTYAGHFGLLAVLTLVATMVCAALPRAANEVTDRGLRQDLGGLPALSRDLVFRADPSLPRKLSPGAAAKRESELPGPLPGLMRERSFAATVGPRGVQPLGPPPFAGSCRPQVQVRYQEAARLVSGRLPRTGATTEVLVSADATDVGLRAGSTLRLGAAPITVVGVFAPYGDELATVPVACPDPREGLTSRIVLLTDVAGIALAGRATGVLDYQWRYSLAVDRLRAADLTAISTAVFDARRLAPASETALSTGLDSALGSFGERLRGVRALLTVVRAGLLATVLGLLLLAARLLADRRRDEFTLLRARGASTGRVLARTLRETAVVVPVVVAGGWALAQLVPGRPDPGDGVLLVLAGVVALLATPLLAAGGRVRFTRTAGAFVVLLAVLGVVLVRRRGLAAGDGDPYLVSVPVLLGVAAAVVAGWVLPWPLRVLARVAARARGAVAFLGLARAGFAAGSLAVLVVAVATGVFTAAVSGTVREARDRATDQEIAADARIDGFAFAPGTGRALASVPGVTAVAALVLAPGAALTGVSGRRTQAQALVVNGPEVARVARVRLPDALTAPAGSGPAPAVVSPEIAREVGAGGTVELEGRRYPFRVAAVVDSLPTLQPGARRFIALPSQALPIPGFQPLTPTRFLVAGDGFEPAALRVAADAGQRENLTRVLGRRVTEAALAQRATVTTWDGHRAALGRGGVNGVLAFTYTAGAAGAAVLALLAVAVIVLAGAPDRGRTLSRLRTMGLSPRQGRRLLIYELVPLVAAAYVAGGLVGILLPRLLGLVDSTAGGIRVDPWLPVAALALLAAALAVAVAVESAAHRRLRLGNVLRL